MARRYRQRSRGGLGSLGTTELVPGGSGAPTPPPPPPTLTEREAAAKAVPFWRRRVLMAPVWLWGALGVAVAVAVWRRKDVAAAVKLVTKLAFPANYGERSGAKIDTVVIHTTEASLASATNWFAMDHAPSGQGPTSAHYTIGKDGTVVLSVPEDKNAFHAGDAAVNHRSIGIELEGAAADPATFTPQMMRALESLSAALVKKYGIPVRRGSPGFIGHLDVPAAAAKGKVDPGPHFPWASFLGRVGGLRVV